MTRRVVKLPKLSSTSRPADARPGRSLAGQSVLEVPYGDPADDPFERVYCPYGAPAMHGVPGDRLWVRETWQPIWASDARPPNGESSPEGWAIGYVATDGRQEWLDEDKGLVSTCKPAIFMRRWMSRITLAITSVRVERLQAITEADAKAEGCGVSTFNACDEASGAEAVGSSYRVSYRLLWDAINGKRPGCAWDANPFVWVVEFKRVEVEGQRRVAT
jgi:hypothetical protein